MQKAKISLHDTMKFQDEIPEEEQKNMTPQAQEQYMFWDAIIKKYFRRYLLRILDLIQAIFGITYPAGVQIELISTEYAADRLAKAGGGYILSCIRADIMVDVGSDSYHFGLQIRENGEVAFRLVEYGFQAALAERRYNEIDGMHEATIQMPKAAVICLTSTRNTPDEELCRIISPTGEEWVYRAPTFKLQDYSPEMLGEKKLYMLIPYTPLRIRKVLRRKNGHTLAKKELTKLLIKCKMVLHNGFVSGDISEAEYRDLLGFTLEACAMIFKSDETMDLLKEACKMFDGTFRMVSDMEEELQAKDELLQAKDEQIQSKDKQIKSKDKQIQSIKEEQEAALQDMISVFLNEMKLSAEETKKHIASIFKLSNEEADRKFLAFSGGKPLQQ